MGQTRCCHPRHPGSGEEVVVGVVEVEGVEEVGGEGEEGGLGGRREKKGNNIPKVSSRRTKVGNGKIEVSLF